MVDSVNVEAINTRIEMLTANDKNAAIQIKMVEAQIDDLVKEKLRLEDLRVRSAGAVAAMRALLADAEKQAQKTKPEFHVVKPEEDA